MIFPVSDIKNIKSFSKVKERLVPSKLTKQNLPEYKLNRVYVEENIGSVKNPKHYMVEVEENNQNSFTMRG